MRNLKRFLVIAAVAVGVSMGGAGEECEAQSNTVATFVDAGGVGHYDYMKATLVLPASLSSNGAVLARDTTNSALTAIFPVVSDSDYLLAFRGCLPTTGSNIQLKVNRGIASNAFDAATAFTWLIPTTSWTAGSTNWSLTNINVSAAAGTTIGNATRFLEVVSLGNGNTTSCSAVRLDVGVNPRLRAPFQ